MKISKLHNRLFSFLILLMSFVNSYAQSDKYEIHLSKVITNKIKVGYDYQLVSQKDTAYVAIKYSGDFGIVYSPHFVMKDNLPDGQYKIYVDNELRKVLFYKGGLKDSLWIEYRDNGEKEIMPYSKGKAEGIIIEYYKDGSVKRKTCIKNNVIKRRVSYAQSGIIIMKEYFRENKQYKIEKFDSKGKVIETKKINN